MNFNDDLLYKIVKYGLIAFAALFVLGIFFNVVVGPPAKSTSAAESSQSTTAPNKAPTSQTASSAQVRDDSTANDWFTVALIVGTVGGLFFYIFRSKCRPWDVPTF